MYDELSKLELSVDDALEQALEDIADKNLGIIHSFGRIFQYYDEPKFYQYYARVADPSAKLTGDYGMAAGFSFFSKKIAALKCLAEALERYSIEKFDKKRIVYSKQSELNKNSLNLSRIVSFSKIQRESSPYLKLDNNAVYGWVLGKELPSMEETYIPAQLVDLLYTRSSGESILRLPISTGAAAGTSLSAAIYRGICEIIERDAFMITYLNKLPRARVIINKSSNPEIKKIVKIAKNYNIDLFLFDISTDLEMYTFLSIAIDKTGIASSVSTGLKSDLNPINAMIGALQEVFHPRSWIRREKDNFNGVPDFNFPTSLSQRGLLWAQLKSVKKLNFLLNNSTRPTPVDDYINRSQGNTLKDLKLILRTLQKKDYNVYYVDITPKLKSIKRTDFKTVMVIIPELQPLYLNEKFRYLGGERLYDIPVKLGYLQSRLNEENLNNFPHPFL